MSQLIEIKVPDIGDYSDVPVIDICVKVGDTVQVDDALVTLESDKATMDVPSSVAGVVKEIKVKLGDKIAEGTVVVLLEAGAASSASAGTSSPSPLAGEGRGEGVAAAAAPATAVAPTLPSPTTPLPQGARGVAGANVEVKVPDIGDYSDVPVIDVCVKVGDTVKVDDALVTLESDKATMDVPSSVAGVVKEVKVKLGDKISEGAVVVVIETGISSSTSAAASSPSPLAGEGRGEGVASTAAATHPSPPTPLPQGERGATATPPAAALPIGARTHASPSVRLFARELGVDLAKVPASGNKGRVTREDINRFVKGVMQTGPVSAPAAGGISGGGTLDLLPWPKIDFAKFGPIEVKPLSRIKKISGANLARNWVMIPPVTYHEDADITELEAFRVALNKENEKSGVKLTMLAFLIKICATALKKFPEFNSSLDSQNGELSLVLKQYCHIGFAADTPNGLVVPVVKNADQKTVLQIAQETTDLSKKARDGKLGPADMSGSCFTISSLGGIGSTYFAPIINAPEVAILGVSKSAMKPVWNGKEFVPRLMLPLSLSADHRVIDGAMGARFNVYIAQLLGDMRRVLL